MLNLLYHRGVKLIFHKCMILNEINSWTLFSWGRPPGYKRQHKLGRQQGDPESQVVWAIADGNQEMPIRTAISPKTTVPHVLVHIYE